MNPNKKDNWAGMSTDEGLIEMAIAYRWYYYRGWSEYKNVLIIWVIGLV